MPKTYKYKTPKQPKPVKAPPARSASLELCLLTSYEMMRFRQTGHPIATIPGTAITVKKDETP